MINRKKIANKTEIELASLIGFHGKYVDSLIKAANRHSYLNGDNVKLLLSQMKKYIKDQLKREAKNFNLSVSQMNSLRSKARQILSSFSTGHSMGCYRKLYLNNNQFASNDSLGAYSNSCKWQPTYGSLSIFLNKKQLKEIENIEGVWTIINKDGSAKWLDGVGKKYSYEVKWVDGFVYGRSHSEISLQHAKELEALKVESQIQMMQKDKKFIGKRHITAIGACEQGIKAFCERCSLNIDFGYQLGFLKSLGDKVAMNYLNKVKG